MSIEENTFFKIDYDSYCEETSEVDPDDEYSRASTSTTHSINGISVVNDESLHCIGAFPVNENIGNVYLVYAVYSTGDSFGNDDGSGIEFIEVFQTEEKANRCALQIQSQSELYNMMSDSYNKYTKEQLTSVMSSVHNCPKINNKGIISSNYFYNVQFQNERNETKSMNVPWNGYFERLDSVSIVEFDLSPKKRNKYSL